MKTCENHLLLKKILKITGITAGVYLAIRFILPLILPFLLAFFLASCLNKIVKKITGNRKDHKKVVGILVFFLFLLVFFAAGGFILYELFTQVKGIFSNAAIWQSELKSYWDGCCSRLSDISGIHADKINHMICEKLLLLWQQGQNRVMACLWNGSISGMRCLFGVLWVLIVIFVATLLTLQDYERLTGRFKASGTGHFLEKILGSMKVAGWSYVKAQLIIMMCVTAICVTGLYFTGNSYALLAGIGIGVCDALPFLGTGTIFIPWMILMLIWGNYGRAAAYLALYLICSVLRELLEPKLVGESVGVHPLFVIFSIYIGIKIYGGAGILAGPLSVFLIWQIYKIIEEKEPE